MNRLFASFLAFALSVPAIFAEFSYSEDPGKSLNIAYKGQAIAKLMVENDTSDEAAALRTYKVYMHIMNPLEPGKTLTKGDGHKFPHHRGIYIGWSKSKIGGESYDTWHMKKGTRQEFQNVISKNIGSDQAEIKVLIHWVNGEEVLLSEERSFTIYAPDEKGSFLLDKVSNITAVKGDAELRGDAQHAGCQFRANEEVVGNKSANYLFAEGSIAEKEVKGKRDLTWAAMNFKVGGKDFHVQHMTHPSIAENLQYSAYRDYGRFGSYMVKTIKKGESYAFPFRFYVSPGAFPETMVQDSIQRYSAFAN